MNIVNNTGFCLNIDDYTLTIEFAESKSSIVDRMLNSRSCISTLLGDDDYYSCFMIIRYGKTGSTNEAEHGAVGVLYNTAGYVPHITAVPHRPAFLLGYNESLCLYDMSRNEPIFQCSIPSASFFCKCFEEGIVVLSELDIVELSYSGEIIKSHHLHGILTNHCFSGLDLTYSAEDGTVGKTIHLFEHQ